MNLAAGASPPVRVKSLYTTMCTLFEQIAAPGTFLVSATALGGQHGYDEAGADAPLGGAVAGFTKTYKRERTAPWLRQWISEPGEIRSRLPTPGRGTLRDPGAVEIGYKNDCAGRLDFKSSPWPMLPGLSSDENSVFVITGAAGSIVSAITADLADASGARSICSMWCPSLIPKSRSQAFVTDKDGLKRNLFARIQARGERATPASVEKELAALERAQAARNAIDAVLAAGRQSALLQR